MNNTAENDVTEVELDELIHDLENESDEPVIKTKRPPFWKNLRRSWTKPKPERQMAVRFQQLAGIITNKDVAALILPDGRRIEFKKLPSWKDVIRFKIAGLTYETYK